MTGTSDIASELRPELVRNLTGEFYVASYQRGYRWGREEVTRLLEDIDPSGRSRYYLQPIVVKRRGGGCLSEPTFGVLFGTRRKPA